MGRSYVVTGGGRGIGRAIVERLLDETDDNAVVAVELDGGALTWLDEHPAGPRAMGLVGDASDEAVAERAADLAEEAGTLSGGSTTPPSSGMPRSTRTGPARC